MVDDGDAADAGLATVASGASLVFVGRVTKLVLLFATQLLMARILGSTDYGGVILATMLAALATTFATAGMEKGLLREVAIHEDDAVSGRGAVRSGLGIAVATGGVGGVVVFLAAPALAADVFGDPALTPLFRLGALSIPFRTVGAVAIAIARGSRDATPHVVVNQLLDPILTFVLVGSLVVAGFGAFGAIAGVVATSLLAAVAALWLGVRSLPFDLRGPSESMHRQVLLFSLPLMLAASMEFVIHHTDTFLIGAFMASADVGVYSIAYQLREVGRFFFYPATFLLPPVITRLAKRDETGSARRIYQLTTKWIVVATTPLLFGVFLFPAVVIRLAFGEEYVPGATALRILLASVMVSLLFGANALALVALGHNRVNLYVDAAAALANVALNLVLIPPFGIAGAAIASAAAFATRDVCYGVALYRWEGIHPASTAMVRPFAGAVLLAGGGYALFSVTLEPTPLTVAAAGVAFLVVYLPLVALVGVIEPEDRRLLDLLETRLGVDLDGVRALIARLE